jgi:hypothetical protein
MIQSKVLVAQAAIRGLFESEKFPKLIEALISNYLVITDEELMDWQANPEEFFLKVKKRLMIVI